MKNFIIPAFLLLIAVPVFGGTKVRTAKVGSRTFVYLQDIAAYYGYKYIKLGDDEYRLQYGRRYFDFSTKKKTVKANGIILYVNDTPRNKNGHVIISYDDLKLQFDSLLRVQKNGKNFAPKIIVIDPGHGGKDSGAIGKRLQEKDINLTVSKYLKAYLQKCGYKVFMTREGDKFLELEERAAFAKKVKADLFISIHANKAKATSAAGIETFQLTPLGKASASGTKRSQKGSGGKYHRYNARLAYEIQRELISITKRKDRGVKYGNFSVLRNSPCPAVLVELGFLSNSLEEKRLTSVKEHKRMALSIARGVVFYHRSMK